MNRLAQDIIDNLRDEPWRWKSVNHHWVRDDGFAVWSANGASHVRVTAPEQLDFASGREQGAVWNAFKAWEANRPLDGYVSKHVEITFVVSDDILQAMAKAGPGGLWTTKGDRP